MGMTLESDSHGSRSGYLTSRSLCILGHPKARDEWGIRSILEGIWLSIYGIVAGASR